jgi:hypothetical protein
MGRGDRNSAVRSAQSLLFGTRTRGVIDYARQVKKALADIDEGRSGPAIVMLRRRGEELSPEEREELASGLTASIISQSLPDLDDRANPEFRLRLDIDTPAVPFNDQDGEVKDLARKMRADLEKELLGNNSKIKFDQKRVIDNLLTGSHLGPKSKQVLENLDKQELLQLTWSLRDSPAPVAKMLRSAIVYQIAAEAEFKGRIFSSKLGLDDSWSPDVTYLKRGGRNKPTLIHLVDREDEEKTVCGSSMPRRRRYIKRGAWLDAELLNHRRCPKCDKKKGEDYFSHASESKEGFSVLSKRSYNRLIRNSRLATDVILNLGRAPTVEDISLAASNLEGGVIDDQRHQIAALLHEKMTDTSVADYQRLSAASHIGGWGMVRKVNANVDYDMDKIVWPSKNKLYRWLKKWPDNTSNDLNKEFAQIMIKANPKRRKKTPDPSSP